MDRINGEDWVDIGSGRRGFRGQDANAGVPGTEVTASWLNGVQEELLRVVEGSEIALKEGDLTQLAQAIRSQRLNYAVAGGTASALTVALSPAIATAPPAGLVLRLKTNVASAAGATLNAGWGPAPIVTAKGAPVAPGDLPAGAITTVVWAGAAWMMGGIAYSEVQQRLTGSLTVYVRPDGNDSNDGLANTPAGAFGTINGAIAAVRQRYAVSGYTVTIQMGTPGTYGPAYFERTSGMIFNIRGNFGSPDGYIIAGGSSFCVGAVGGANVDVLGVRFTGTGRALEISSGSTCTYGRCTFASTGTHIYTTYGGIAIATDSYTIAAGGVAHLFAGPGGHVIVQNLGSNWVTLNGTPAFSAAFVATSGGFVAGDGSIFSGAATGKRYSADLGGIISTAGAGANFFPGSIAGTTSSGGVYV